jgi:uncharacterized protein (TIGR02284 family)
MADTDHDISTLNSLIATTIDSVNGYTEAAKDSDNSRYTMMFNSRATERRAVVTTLQGEVRRMGGEPEDDGTMLASMHRGWTGLKSAVTGKDEKAIVDEVERGEDHIKAKFEDAMADADVSAATMSAIEAAWHSVKEGHDEMRDLKHSMERS